MASYRSSYTTWKSRLPSESSSTSLKGASSTSSINSTPLYSSRYSSGTSNYSRPYGKASEPKEEPTVKKVAPPPVSYRGLGTTSTGARSRDPSPAASDAALGSRLRSYARSTSREPADTPSTIDRIASKYGGRASITKNTPSSNSNTPAPKEERTKSPPKYSGRSSTERSLSSYSSRQPSREDLSVKTYINSRFLPKNSVERSTTAYAGLRCASAIEERRKRDSLLLTHAQLSSRKREPSPPQRQSSSTLLERTRTQIKPPSPIPAPVEVETISVVTRGTSPGPPRTGTPRRTELVAREVKKEISRPKIRPQMVDKQIQSDRLDDTARYSRFGSSLWTSSNSNSLSIGSTRSSLKADRSSDKSTTSLDTSSNKSNTSRQNLTSLETDSKSSRRTPEVDKSRISRQNSSYGVGEPKSRSASGNLTSLESDSKSSRNSPEKPRIGSRQNSTFGFEDSKSRNASGNLTSLESDSKNSRSSPEKPRIGSRQNSSFGFEEPKSRSASGNLTSLETDSKSFGKVPERSRNGSGSNLTSLETDSKSKIGSRQNSSSSLNPQDSKSKIGTYSRQNSQLEKVNGKGGLASRQNSSSNLELKSGTKSGSPNKTSLESDFSKSRGTKSGEKTSKLPTQNGNTSRRGSPVTSLETNSSQMKNGINRSSSSRSVSSSESLPISKGKTNSSTNLPKSSGNTSGNANGSGQFLPPLPKSASSGNKISIGEGQNLANKDFRKSVLNMNGGEGPRRRRVESASTASEDEDRTSAAVDELPSATEVPEKTQSRSFILRAFQPITNRLSCVTRVESGERAWWLRDDAEVPEGIKVLEPDDPTLEEDDSLRHIDSELDDDNDLEALGDRASPEGVEADQQTSLTGRLSPYDNVPSTHTSKKGSSKEDLFISKHTNIDDVLGGSAGTQPMSPLLDKIMTFCNGVVEPQDIPQNLKKLDDAALQMYKDGDYGSYLDLEASINEQHEEFEGFHTNKKNSLVLRTQLSVRVHAIIERLSTSEGRDLRRALFSLKQVFQEDKDLVHEFVRRDGLGCLVRVGQQQYDDQNHQSYILRALGQLMLYVDGMNGVMEHPPTVQWLYSLVASRYRLVVKTALKLLLVFVEYTEANCARACRAVYSVDREKRGLPPWRNVMRLLEPGSDGARSGDHELLILAATLVNRCLQGLPDQDQYYDQVDALEEQGMERVVRWYMSRPGTDLDLLHQLHVYEATLAHEDDVPINETTLDYQISSPVPRLLRQPSSAADRKSRRHSTGAKPQDSPQELPGELSPIGPDHAQAGVTPALRRRRERAERQRSFIREQQESAAALAALSTNGHERPHQLRLTLSPPQTPLSPTGEGCMSPSVRDLTHRLAAGLASPTSPPPTSPSAAEENLETTDMRGAVSRAKQGLAKSQSKVEVTPPTSVRSPTNERPATPPPPAEGELRWDEVRERAKGRPLKLCDLDFTDLTSDDEVDVLSPIGSMDGVAPPPPPPPSIIAPPPPQGRLRISPPPPPVNVPPPPPLVLTKTKKTVKLFWREVRREDQGPITENTVWDELDTVPIDTQKLEHLFESRAKDLITKKQQEMNKNKEIIVLDHKRSNAINIGMTKLPPARSIKTAILKMDATVVSREGIDKLLTMLPTEEEKIRIQEAQAAQPELPLGSAEQFLITLASISELYARLKLWAFKLDFESAERDIAEPLMDLKQGTETLRRSKTFRAVLATLRSIGAFLNGQPHVKGFHVDYLAKVPEVKDTVHKHSLLHHLCHIVMERFPDATDLYSELGAVTRASRVDFEELAADVRRLESDCAASWLHLRAIAKHDGTTLVKARMGDFLSECAERIVALGCVHRRVMNRWRSFLLWLGVGPARAQQRDLRPNELCRVISEFALEYRTTRERVLQQLEKKATHRERNKTRGKLITDLAKTGSNSLTPNSAEKADRELRQLLQRPAVTTNNTANSAEDELLETLVRTATKAPASHHRPQPQRERKRTRHADRKSLRRTLRHGLSDEERKHIAAYIKGY